MVHVLKFTEKTSMFNVDSRVAMQKTSYYKEGNKEALVIIMRAILEGK